MGLLDIIRHNKIKEPIFLNQHEDERLKILEDLLNKVGDDQKQLILDEMNLVRIGLSGENNVIYELKHSSQPIIFLHDISLLNGENDSQIDFIVITRKAIIVLETKKLIGDITIDNEGNFIRYFKNSKGEVYKKEGIYSPITQNKYHVDAIKKLLDNNKYPKLLPIISLVVIANQKTIINKKYTNTEIKNQVIKYDQLNNIIDNIINEYDIIDISDALMLEIGDFLLENNICKNYDYITKLKLDIMENGDDSIKVIEEITDSIVDTNDELYEKLRSYRYNKSIEQGVKPYMIFSNDVLQELILTKPKTKEEFISINGLGEKKYNMLGNEIIKIIHPEQNFENTALVNKDNICNDLLSALKQYRVNKASEEKIPLYFIYNNNEMEDLIAKLPSSLEELINVKGFGRVRVEKYGQDILDIINKYKK